MPTFNNVAVKVAIEVVELVRISYSELPWISDEVNRRRWV